MQGIPPEPDGAEDLASVADELKESLDALNVSVGVLSGKAESNRRIVISLATLVVLKLITIVVIFVIIVNMAHTNRRLQASVRQTQATEQEQVAIRTRTLCPLYSFLLETASNPAVRQSLSPATQSVFDAEYKIIKDGYTAMNCTR